ncbi:MAG: hypothetical protein JXQ89_09645 [Pelagimonas sp.]
MSKFDDLVKTLKRNYEEGILRREATTAIHLFGIEHHAELEGEQIYDVAEQATGRRSYGTEIRKGMKLAQYVMRKV